MNSSPPIFSLSNLVKCQKWVILFSKKSDKGNLPEEIKTPCIRVTFKIHFTKLRLSNFMDPSLIFFFVVFSGHNARWYYMADQDIFFRCRKKWMGIDFGKAFKNLLKRSRFKISKSVKIYYLCILQAKKNQKDFFSRK